MKDKLEPNMYVRTKWGYICKIININDFREPSMKYGVEASYLKDIMFIGDDDILKASHNIIDLIEVGDYVNGYLVLNVLDFNDNTRILSLERIYDNKITEEDIKSIVTKEQLNSLVNSCQEEIRILKKQLQERPKEYVFIGNAQNKTRDFINQITKDNKEFKNQQKEFIEYMNKTIEELECDDVDDEEMKGYLIQIIDTFKEILSKYKSIIGGKE